MYLLSGPLQKKKIFFFKKRKTPDLANSETQLNRTLFDQIEMTLVLFGMGQGRVKLGCYSCYAYVIQKGS